MRIPYKIKRASLLAIAHAREEPEQEVCGLIIDGRIVRGTNVAEGEVTLPDGTTRQKSPKTDFKLDDETFRLWEEAKQSGKSVVVYHSHVGTATDFSRADVENIYATECPWLLVHTPTETTQYFDPTVVQPYENREWHWAYSNCSTLVRDWLKREMNFDLEIPIPNYPGEWRASGWNEMLLYGDRQLERQPRDFKNLKRGDVIIFLIDGESRFPEHVGVVTDPVRNEFLHHLVDQLSTVRTLSAAYQKATYQIYRIPNAENN